MNLLLISASPHREKSQTYRLAEELLACNVAFVSVEVIHLCDLKIEFCTGCSLCHKKVLHCPLKDDVFALLEKMLAADGIILATPNYINQVTGAMKTLFDRSSHLIHCKRLLGKYIAGVVTSGSGNDKGVVDYLEYYSHACGAQFVGSVSSRIPLDDAKKKEAADLGKKLVEACKTHKIYPQQQEIIDSGKAYFRKIMESRKDEWSGEYLFWKEKSWL